MTREQVQGQVWPLATVAWRGITAPAGARGRRTRRLVPLRSSSVGAEGSGLSWRLSLQLRASPAPAALSVVSGGCYQGAVRNASGWFGMMYIPRSFALASWSKASESLKKAEARLADPADV